MKVVFRPLVGHDRDLLAGIVRSAYLSSPRASAVLAIAISRCTGLPLYAVKGKADGRLLHVYVRGGKKTDPPIDARGPTSLSDMPQMFPEEIKIVCTSESGLAESGIGELKDEELAGAKSRAQALWPDLPWNVHAFYCQCDRFFTELEELCRAYGVFMQAPTGTHIMLEPAHGDEGITYSPTANGTGCHFDRILLRQG